MGRKKRTAEINVSNVPEVITPQSMGQRVLAAKGRTAVSDVGAKLRNLANLKPGSETMRTPQMIDEIVYRLLEGESLLSVCTDPDMPSHATICMWMRDDHPLRSLITWARTEGTHVLFDAMQDIAQAGFFTLDPDGCRDTRCGFDANHGFRFGKRVIAGGGDGAGALHAVKFNIVGHRIVSVCMNTPYNVTFSRQ